MLDPDQDSTGRIHITGLKQGSQELFLLPRLAILIWSGVRAGGAGGKVRETHPTGQHGEEHSHGERTERVRAGGHGESDGATLLLRGYVTPRI